MLQVPPHPFRILQISLRSKLEGEEEAHQVKVNGCMGDAGGVSVEESQYTMPQQERDTYFLTKDALLSVICCEQRQRTTCIRVVDAGECFCTYIPTHTRGGLVLLHDRPQVVDTFPQKC